MALDGLNKGRNEEEKALDTLMHDWKKCTSRVFHVLGNHELYCFNKDEARRRFDMAAWNYVHSPKPGFKIIVCDAYGMSTLTPDLAEESFQYLEKHNPNNVRSTKVDWVKDLKGLDRRYVPYNGGLGAAQLKWLEKELDCDDKIIVCSHIPLCPGSAVGNCECRVEKLYFILLF